MAKRKGKGKKKRRHCTTNYNKLKRRDRLILACYQRIIDCQTRVKPSKKIYNRHQFKKIYGKDLEWK